MAKWNTRVAGYKFSLIMSYVVFLVYALAFGIPMWLGKDEGIMGLWAAGKGYIDDIDDVEATGFGELAFGSMETVDRDVEAWLEAVRALWLGGMAFYLFGVVASMVENCRSSESKDYGVSGILMLLAGLCGSAGVITFAVEVEDHDSYKESDYFWGYILAVIASGLAIILAIVLLISRNYELQAKDSRTADYVFAHNKQNGHSHHQQRPYAPEYNNPGYRGDELPLVNGVPFHQQPYGQSPYSMYRTGQENGYSSNKFDQGTGYYPYGYKDPRPGNRASMAESADLSNGYTQDIVHAEHSLGRNRDYAGNRSQSQSQYNRGDYYYNGSRPY